MPCPAVVHNARRLPVSIFFDVLFLLLVAYALILKALRFPDKPAGLTSVGKVLIGAVPRSRVSSGNCKVSCLVGPPPPYSYFPVPVLDARIKLSITVAGYPVNTQSAEAPS